MNVFALLLTSITFFSTLSGGLIATKFRVKLEYFTAFAAGVLIGVPLFELLPESLNLANTLNIPIEFIMYITAIGFIFLFILERYFSVHRVCEEDICQNVHHPKGGIYGAIELSGHSFMDGFSIGLGFQFNFTVGLIVAIAVISHDFSDGLNTATLMLKSGNSRKRTLMMLILDAITPLMGVIVTLFINFPEVLVVIIIPFFAGGFLYLGAGDLLPEAHEKNPSAKTLALSISGILIAFIISIILNI